MMFGKRPFRLSRCLTALVAFVLCGAPTSAVELRYRIVDLGPVEGGSRTSAFGLNDLGDVVGHTIVDTANGNIANSRPVVWRNGGAPERLWYGELEACYLDAELGYICDIDKPLVFGDLIGADPRAINNAGVIVGQAQSRSYTGIPLPTGGIPDGVAFVWNQTNGRRTLGTLGGSNSEARAINDAGVVVGSADVLREFDFGQGPVVRSVPRAFIWDEVNGMRDLGTLGEDDDESRGMGINNHGQIVGWSALPDGRGIAFLWDEDGGMRALDGLAPTSSSRAFAINDLGIVVGYSRNSQGIPRAVRWNSDGEIIELGVVPGDHSSIAWSINDNGYAIGTSYSTGSEQQPFIWSHEYGMTSLVDLVINGTGWELFNAWGINERNEIVGTGRLNGTSAAFVMVPVPEPRGILLAVVLFGCFALFGFRSRLHSTALSENLAVTGVP